MPITRFFPSNKTTRYSTYHMFVKTVDSDSTVLNQGPLQSCFLTIFSVYPSAKFFFFLLIHCSLHYKNNRYVECAFSIYTQASLCLTPDQKKKKKILVSLYHHRRPMPTLRTSLVTNQTQSVPVLVSPGEWVNPLPSLRCHFPVCKIRKFSHE